MPNQPQQFALLMSRALNHYFFSFTLFYITAISNCFSYLNQRSYCQVYICNKIPNFVARGKRIFHICDILFANISVLSIRMQKIVAGLVLTVLVHKSWAGHYLNQYAVDILPGQDPDVVAKEVGCENTGEYFVFTFRLIYTYTWCFYGIDPCALYFRPRKKVKSK